MTQASFNQMYYISDYSEHDETSKFSSYHHLYLRNMILDHPNQVIITRAIEKYSTDSISVGLHMCRHQINNKRFMNWLNVVR